MRNMLKALFSAPQAKASRAARLIAIESGGRALDAARLSRARPRGLSTNAIVHRAVKLVAEGAASVTYLAYEGDAAREPHPLTSLLARPNPAPGARGVPGGVVRAPAAGRQRLRRGGDARWRGARALCAAARPHARGAGAGRLAGGLRICGCWPHAALRVELSAAADPASGAIPSARRSLRIVFDRARRGRDRTVAAGMPGFAFTLLHALWTGHDAGINGFVNLSALLMGYFGARFGVLGIYVNGRGKEKQASATGDRQPSVGEGCESGRQEEVIRRSFNVHRLIRRQQP